MTQAEAEPESAVNQSGNSRFLQTTFALGHLANDWPPSTIWLLAPAIALAMDLSPAQVGLLITIHMMGAALAYVPAGVLADRFSHRGRLLLATFWWVAIGYFAASLAPNFWVLVIALALAGMGDAAWHPIATGVLVRQMPQRRGQALGVHAMGGTFAEVLGPLTVGFLLSYMDWRSALQISVIPTVVMGFVFIAVARRVPRSAESAITWAEARQLIDTWRRPQGLGLIAMMTLYNMALYALMSMTPVFLQFERSYSPALAGVVFALALSIGSVAQPFIGRLSDTTGRKRVFVTGSILAALAALLAAVGPGEIAEVTALIAAMATLVAIRSGILALAVEFAAMRETINLGLIFMVLDGVGAFGALLAGLAGEFDLRYAFALAGLFTLLSIVAAILTPIQTAISTGRAPLEAS